MAHFATEWVVHFHPELVVHFPRNTHISAYCLTKPKPNVDNHGVIPESAMRWLRYAKPLHYPVEQ